MNFITQELAQYFERPAKVQIDITNKCNFDCVYCYNKSNDFINHASMTDDEYKILCDRIIEELDPVVISFSGGEPLVKHELLLSLLKKFMNRDYKTWLTTNLSLMTKNLAYQLKEAGLCQIFTNIDASDATTHDTLRGHRGSFNDSAKKIEYLVEIFGGENVISTQVITNQNYKDLIEVCEISRNLGIKKIHFLDFIPTSETSKELMLNKKQWLDVRDAINDYNYKEDISLQLCHSFLFMSNEYEKAKFPFCMAGRFTMLITACGEVVPCNHLKKEEFACGNIKNKGLLEIWQNSEILKKFRFYDYSDQKCFKCKRYKKCAGGCKAMTYMDSGNAFSIDPYCKEFDAHDTVQRE